MISSNQGRWRELPDDKTDHPNLAPSSALFSQAIKVGSTICISGIAGIGTKTNQITGLTIQEQTRQAFLNCENILLTGSAKLENVVLLVRLDDFVGLNEEYAKFFPIDPPTRPVAKLGDELPDVLVSTEMIVAL